MLWLFVLVALVQSTFYWVLKPLILFLTPVLEFRSLGIVVVVVLVWLISGKSREDPLT